MEINVNLRHFKAFLSTYENELKGNITLPSKHWLYYKIDEDEEDISGFWEGFNKMKFHCFEDNLCWDCKSKDIDAILKEFVDMEEWLMNGENAKEFKDYMDNLDD